MIFLINYDRASGKIASMGQFPDSDRQGASDARLALELDLKSKGIDHEVVLLEAASEEGLRRTHRRYFEEIATLAQVPSENGGGHK